MKYRLDVPYREKDEAKALGARWDPTGKYWYSMEVPGGGLERWYRGTPGIQTTVSVVVSGGAEGGVKNQTDPADRDGDAYRNYMTVTGLCQMIEGKFQTIPEFQTVYVKGEVTNSGGHKEGGHYYFSIKDEESLIGCIMFSSVAEAKLKFSLEDGKKVAIVGNIDFYTKTGKSQIRVSDITDIGKGEAMLALIRLKQKLEAENLFDPALKKPVPAFAKTVGIVTSKSGQAIQDIVAVAKMKNPYVQLILYPVNVQGRDAVPTIKKGIRTLDQLQPDAIIVGRGGGSVEELMAFNDEGVIREVFAAKTPIISAVGHAGNQTLIDLVADAWATTPTKAAEMVLADVMSAINRAKELKTGIEAQMRSHLKNRRYQLEAKRAGIEKYNPEAMIRERREKASSLMLKLNSRMEGIFRERKHRSEMLSEGLRRLSPQVMIAQRKDEAQRMQENIRIRMASILEERKHRYEVLLAGLNGLSPTAKLVNGFGYVSHEEKPVLSVKELKSGDEVSIRIHDGEILSEVKQVKD
ncbi:MAG: exodeoxyribonuclease VII large subunit [Lachnospiraceae bacterium]|nr:exodeoxyribonuclease VII large subunit [Lachnospiraceae bacterium]